MANASALLPFIALLGIYKLQPFTPLTNNHFASELSSLVVYNKFTKNAVYSPLSLHTSLALILMGAADHTESEIRQAIKLGNEPKENLAIKYGFFLNDTFENEHDGQQLLISNGLFVSDKINISKRFSDLASYYFKGQLENIDFSQAEKASERINDWVRQRTNDNKRDLIQPDSLRSNTKAVLVNTIYFEGIWQYLFNANNSKKRDFYMSPSKKVSVNTMSMNYYFRYAELPMLKAKALKLPFRNSRIYMLIILPNEIDGLQKLEIKLKGIDLNKVAALMKRKYVNVYLPKFRMVSGIDLKEPLKRMGLSSLFENANLTHMFEDSTAPEISNIKQKALLTCSEAGVSSFKIPILIGPQGSMTPPKIIFRADHPFVFVIRSEALEYFFGHVAKF